MSDNIEAVRKVIMQDRHVAYSPIEVMMGINMTSIYKILHKYLISKQSYARGISHNLPENYNKIQSWCFKSFFMQCETGIYAYKLKTEKKSTM